MKKNIGRITALLVAGILVGASPRVNAVVVFDLGSVMSGDTPGSTPPWLRATITQDGADVLVKMEALRLVTSPNVEAVDDWAFNLNPAYLGSSLTATEVDRSGAFTTVILSDTPNLGYAGFSFDFGFGYPNPVLGDALAHRFTDGDSITFRLSRTGGLAEADFNYLTPPQNGQQYYSGAHIISIGDNEQGSAFVGAPIPEPSTYIAGGLLLIPLLVQIRRWRRSG